MTEKEVVLTLHICGEGHPCRDCQLYGKEISCVETLCKYALDLIERLTAENAALRAWGIEDAGTDDISNLMPSCRMCNHYKRANSLETFRRYIAEIPRKLRENYIYKIGVVYGNVIENEKPIEFYFERMEARKSG